MQTRFILVGLLYLCGLSSQDCSVEFLENKVLLGAEIEFLRSPDVEHCQQLCTEHPSCRFFTFVRPDSGDENRHFYCYFKSTSSGEPEGQAVAQGVTSGFSLKDCSRDSKPCLSQVYHNVDFFGADYRALFTPDYEECQRACTNEPSCQFFTFINENYTSAEHGSRIRYKCHLKFSWTIPRIMRIQAKAGLVSGFSHKVETTQQSEKACQTKVFPMTDIPGNNVEDLTAASTEHCQALCTAHPKCSYFSYVSGSRKCRLKNNLNEMVVRAKDGVTSGIAAYFCQLDNAWVKTTHEGVDFWGSDYHNVLATDADDCQRICTEDPNCQYYTFVTDSFHRAENRRICYLKRTITMPAPPKVAKLANAVSGFSLKNCGLPPSTPVEVSDSIP